MSLLVAIDWGSSNRRAYLLDHGGDRSQILERHCDAHGVLTSKNDFAASLDALLARWPDLPADAPVVMSGMIGSRSGWVEAPYLSCPARLDSLGRHLVDVASDGRFASLATRSVSIVPGVCQRTEPDVMRGEEIQILGAMLLGGGDGIYVLPGTHSKWVRVENGSITAFRSFMTGELFALLGKHSSLSALITQDDTSPAESRTASFAEGVASAARGEALSHLLFGLRASVLLGAQDVATSTDWLSGVLVGSEWHDARVREWLASGEVRIVGEAHLAARYADVAESLGITSESLEPEAAFVAAVHHVWSNRS